MKSFVTACLLVFVILLFVPSQGENRYNYYAEYLTWMTRVWNSYAIKDYQKVYKNQYPTPYDSTGAYRPFLKTEMANYVKMAYDETGITPEYRRALDVTFNKFYFLNEDGTFKGLEPGELMSILGR